MFDLLGQVPQHCRGPLKIIHKTSDSIWIQMQPAPQLTLVDSSHKLVKSVLTIYNLVINIEIWYISIYLGTHFILCEQDATGNILSEPIRKQYGPRHFRPKCAAATVLQTMNIELAHPFGGFIQNNDKTGRLYIFKRLLRYILTQGQLLSNTKTMLQDVNCNGDEDDWNYIYHCLGEY